MTLSLGLVLQKGCLIGGSNEINRDGAFKDHGFLLNVNRLLLPEDFK
jgi:hypothetical protein